LHHRNGTAIEAGCAEAHNGEMRAWWLLHTSRAPAQAAPAARMLRSELGVAGSAVLRGFARRARHATRETPFTGMLRATRMTITVVEAGRIDKALAKQFPDASRRALAELFAEGAVRIAGRRAKKGERVEAGTVVELARAPVTGEDLRVVPDPEVALVVLLERAELVAIDKPTGMPSQPLRAGERGCAANAIVARWPECAQVSGDARDGGLVQRLDIGTSGVLVAARTAEMHRALRGAFAAGQVEKEYVAITCARPVARDCDAPLAQRGDHVRVDEAEGMPAHTEFVVEREANGLALVRCRTRTGRMHQVRAHLAYVGAPIAGDALYGGAALEGFDGFFLHAAKVVLPVGDGRVVIEAGLPERFMRAARGCGLLA
jgi:23S rRNA pseudouridine1911/1915/1917 synthase